MAVWDPLPEDTFPCPFAAATRTDVLPRSSPTPQASLPEAPGTPEARHPRWAGVGPHVLTIKTLRSEPRALLGPHAVPMETRPRGSVTKTSRGPRTDAGQTPVEPEVVAEQMVTIR